MKKLLTNLCLALLASFLQNSFQLNQGTLYRQPIVRKVNNGTYCVKVSKTIYLSVYKSRSVTTVRLATRTSRNNFAPMMIQPTGGRELPIGLYGLYKYVRP